MVTRRGGAPDVERARSLGADVGVSLTLGGGTLFMLTGLLDATLGSRPRGLVGVPEAEESSELLIGERRVSEFFFLRVVPLTR
jgi:hypothetical protein